MPPFALLDSFEVPHPVGLRSLVIVKQSHGDVAAIPGFVKADGEGSLAPSADESELKPILHDLELDGCSDFNDSIGIRHGGSPVPTADAELTQVNSSCTEINVFNGSPVSARAA